MDSYLLSQGFIRCKSDPNVYMLRSIDSLLIIVLYVDDLLITGSSISVISTVKTTLHDRFSMTDMGPLHYFLGLEINQSDSGIKVTQSKYVKYLLVRFQITDCKSTATPFLSGVKLEDIGDTPLVDCTRYRQLAGSPLYFAHSRPDLSYAIGAVSRYMQEPHELHWKAFKRIIWYVKETTSYGIHYESRCTLDLVGYTDFDWLGDAKDRKSTLRYVFSIGSGPIYWSRKKQSIISLSSSEAKYKGVVNATTQVIWLQNFLIELGVQFHQPTVIWCDN